MATVVLRLVKGAALTYEELDGNFANLNTSKLEVVNLSLGTVTTSNIVILNSGGASVTIPAATTANAGLLTGTQKNQLDGLQANLNAKANLVHSHTIADVTNLQTTLNGKANLVHTHEIANVTGLQSALDGKLSTSGTAASAVRWQTARSITLGGDASGSVVIDGTANVTLTVAVADDSHNHIISNVDGLQTALDGKLSFANLSVSTSTTTATINNSGGTNATLVSANVSAAGLMTSADKVKLDLLDGKTIYVANTAPLSPNVGDLWLDIS